MSANCARGSWCSRSRACSRFFRWYNLSLSLLRSITASLARYRSSHNLLFNLTCSESTLARHIVVVQLIRYLLRKLKKGEKKGGGRGIMYVCVEKVSTYCSASNQIVNKVSSMRILYNRIFHGG